MKKSVTKSLFILNILIVTVFIAVSCNRSGEEDPVKAEAAGDKIVNSENKKKPEQQGTGGNEGVEQKAVISETEGRDFLLFYDDMPDIVVPRDYKIGQLQQKTGIDPVISDIINTASAFLESIKNGDPDYKLVAVEKRDFVERNLERQMQIILPEDFRIGIIMTEAEPVNAAVRFINNGRYSEGMLYFVNKGQWKIYDFQMDFKKMTVPEEGKEENLWETVSAE